MTRKLISLLLVAGIVYMALTQKTWFIHTLKSGGNFPVLLIVLLIALLVFIPILPAIAAAGIVGSIYGTWEGTAITLSGAMLGTMAMFFLARFGFSSWAEKIIQKYSKARKYDLYFEQHAFFTVWVSRLIPIIPTTLVNVLSGIRKISWISFFIASLLGKLPIYILYNFAGRQMTIHRRFSFLLYGAYSLVVVMVTFIYTWNLKKKREELR